MQDLQSYLTNYKNITINLIHSLEGEDFEQIENLLDLRQQIIENISNLDFIPEIFKKIGQDLCLVDLETRAKKLIEQKHGGIKASLERTRQNQRANSNYFKNNPSESIFFNKKI